MIKRREKEGMNNISRIDSKCVFKNILYVNYWDSNWFGNFAVKKKIE